MKTTDIDVSTRPGKWVKRGPRPAVESAPPSPIVALNHLAARIREESDPNKKRALELQYAADAKAIESLTSDPKSIKLGEVIAEMVTVFTPITDPHPDYEEGLRMPETMTRDQWSEVHGRIMQCRHAAAKWLSQSRRFATDRWGVEFVSETEQQMELALGLERLPAPERAAIDYDALATSLAKRASKWAMDDVDQWDNARRQRVLDLLAPVVGLIERLRAWA